MPSILEQVTGLFRDLGVIYYFNIYRLLGAYETSSQRSGPSVLVSLDRSLEILRRNGLPADF